MANLDDASIEAALRDLPNWKREGSSIVREYEARNVRAAVRLIERICDVAEGANHHPDLTWSYVHLKIAFTTHATGGLTKRDFHVARVVEDLLSNG